MPDLPPSTLATRRFLSPCVAFLLAVCAACPAAAQTTAAEMTHTQTDNTRESYQHFDAAIYARAYEVREMADLDWLHERFDVMNALVKVDKIYLETHRDTLLVEEETLLKAKQFFAERGIRTAGGITLTINERNRFETFCYSNPEHRQWVQHVVEYTAKHFDEVILDDFFFTSCKSEGEIAAKGDRSWTAYRLALMDEVARNVIIGPAKAVNPNVTVIVKYPNWYEHFQGLGFNLETEPALFDKLYTGTETRDAVRSAQHLQPYLGYNIFRYFENLKPGYNGGGWVDTGGMRTLDRYAEQLWVTLFAKAPEITLFDFRQLQRPLTAEFRAPWQGQGTSLDFDAVVAPYRQADGTIDPALTLARAAGYALEKVDGVLGALGTPIGVPSYRPFHATGEDFLHNFLGMIGIPIDLRPTFPAEAPTLLLTESAKFDPEIVSKIKQQLMDGKDVVITSGLLQALEGRGIRDIAELEVTARKALVDEFIVGWDEPMKARKKILIPQIHYLTNDSWEQIMAVDGAMGWPMLHDADYANGHLYILTIPDNFADLYALPDGVLARIKRTVMQNFFVRVDGPSEVALFAYDNDAFVVESFLGESTEVRLITDGHITRLRDVETGEVLTGTPVGDAPWPPRPDAGKVVFDTQVKPHSYRVFVAQ